MTDNVTSWKEQSLELAKSLLNEVASVVTSGGLFVGSDVSPESIVMKGKGGDVSCSVTDSAQFRMAVNQGQDPESPIEIYVDLLKSAADWWVGVSSYSIVEHIDELFDELIDEILPSDHYVKPLSLLASRLFDSSLTEFSKPEFKNYLMTMVDNQICMICNARMLTLRKCFIPTEITFEALKNGLLPYGWSNEQNALLCLDPKLI